MAAGSQNHRSGVSDWPTGDDICQARTMLVLVLAMVVCLGLAVAVVLLVAVPARREGRDLLTPKGEHVMARMRERTESVAAVTKDRAGELVSAAKDKVGEVRPAKGGPGQG